MKNTSFVLIGHVDHGKSTFIGRLLFETNSLPVDKITTVKSETGKDEFAYFLDSFKEEREKGITIDTTQVFFSTKDKEYTIIDVPGHEEFIKNMISGASYADLGVLIVDINEGIKEQTKRHVVFLSYMGIEKLIVLINKMDTVRYEQTPFLRLVDNLKDFFSCMKISVACYIPVSAKKGDNILNRASSMQWYKGPTFLEAIENTKITPEKSEEVIFSVQDVYNHISSQKIIVGRVDSGSIRINQRLKVFPSENNITVSEILKFPHTLEKASYGECVGIKIKEEVNILRGNLLIEKQSPLSTMEANVFLFQDTIKINEKTKIFCGTQSVEAFIKKISKRVDPITLECQENSLEIKPLEVGSITIEPTEKLFFRPYREVKNLGRFVLSKGEKIIGGGIVV